MNLVSVSHFKWILVIQKFKRKFLFVEIKQILGNSSYLTAAFLDTDMPNFLTNSSFFPYICLLS